MQGIERYDSRRTNNALPIDLGGGLLLRWAEMDDIEEVAEFNIRVHSDEPDKPEKWLGDWTRDLMQGRHPSTGIADFTVVVDHNHGGKVVSSLCLISQTWTFDGIPFGAGRIELVGTDPAYRRRGLIREQMTVIHNLSAAKGELIQAITGIPLYYRQFGYEMALNLSGGREYFWIRHGNDRPVEEEAYSIRRAETADIPLLEDLYAVHCGQSLVACQRKREEWVYGLTVANPETPAMMEVYIIENAQNHPTAYVSLRQWGTGFTIREMGVEKGSSWREACLFLVRHLKQKADKLNKSREQPITNTHFLLGESHPVYDALGDQLERRRKPYAWFIRVPDLKMFLGHVTPVLDQRLAESVMAGFSGNLRLNFYRNNLSLSFKNGRISKIEAYEPTRIEDADALFPDLTFLQLLFGYRSLEELNYSFADCYTLKPEAAVLLNALFPRHPSDVSPIH